MTRLLLSACVVGLVAHGASGREILFVGNSFTHGNGQPAFSYNAGAITDANGTNMGGVPAIFKKMSDQSGQSANVTIEAVSSMTLEGHFQTRSSILGQETWDDVVLQEYSTRPLPTSKGGENAKFNTAVGNIRSLVGNASGADVYLYETWARPDLTFPTGSPYAGLGLGAMTSDLHNAYFATATTYGLAGVAPVGDAFLRAVNEGVANPSPYDAAPAGTIDLWASDRYHASKYGSYLSAAVLFATLTDTDPRTLATGSDSAAAGLGISPADAARLNLVAYRATVPEPATLAVVAGISSIMLRRRRFAAARR